MKNLLDKAVTEARKLPKSVQDDIGSVLLSFVHRASENMGNAGSSGSFSLGNNGEEVEYGPVDVNMAIARGILEAKAHQRGEIELPNARETLEALANNRAA